MTPWHKFLDVAQHLSYYIAALFSAIAIIASFLWKDRNANKKRIINNEKQYEQLAWMMENNVATKADLRACREDVDNQDDENLKAVLGEIKNLRGEVKTDSDANHASHTEILQTMIKLHSGNGD